MGGGLVSQEAAVKWLVLAAAGVWLGGCVPYAQRVARFCEQLGAAPQSQEYWGCVRQQMQLDQENENMWAGTTAAGAALLEGPPRVYVYPGY